MKKRWERILNIPNLEPLKYETYIPLKPSNQYIELNEWSYTCCADGNVSYGDFERTNWPESVNKYLNSLPFKELYFFVPYTTSSDYSGSTIEKANAKYFENTYTEYDWIHLVFGYFNINTIAINVSALLNCDEDTFNELCTILEDLENYPLIDDKILCELEMELSDEAWDSWGESDFIVALENKFPNVIFDWPNDLRVFFEEKAKKANEYWECEGYGSNMHIRIDQVVKKIDFKDVEKWELQ